MGKDFHAITPLDLRVQREKEDLAKQVLRSRFPELVVLVQGLSCVFSRYVGRTEAETVVERQANP